MKDKEKQVKYRHELKYVISAAQIPLLKSRISSLMSLDPHAGADGIYNIRSLYFDNLYDKALVEITTIVLKRMSNGSCIINTCSIASFAPNARMAVYSSTKAYVMSFSRALRLELKPKKINVLSVRSVFTYVKT